MALSNDEKAFKMTIPLSSKEEISISDQKDKIFSSII